MKVLNSRSKSPATASLMKVYQKKVHRRIRLWRLVRSRFSARRGYSKPPQCVFKDGELFLSVLFEKDYCNHDDGESSYSDMDIDDEEDLVLLEESPVCVVPDRRRVHFSAGVSVVDIPSHHELSEGEKDLIWTSSEVLRVEASRNRVEWTWESRNVDYVVEEGEFRREFCGNLVHPAHRSHGVQFAQKVSVVEIPSHRDFSKEAKEQIWTSSRVIRKNKRRNIVEWRWEGRNVDRVVEEYNFTIDCDANLVHPAHIKKPAEVMGERRAPC
jgi:hypothetical protein